MVSTIYSNNLIRKNLAQEVEKKMEVSYGPLLQDSEL